MESNVIFYPMSEIPARDESDASFSQTVLIYNNKFNFVDLGYFDFEQGEWSYFGENSFLLKCWCYIPVTPKTIRENDWKVISPKRR